MMTSIITKEGTLPGSTNEKKNAYNRPQINSLCGDYNKEIQVGNKVQLNYQGLCFFGEKGTQISSSNYEL